RRERRWICHEESHGVVLRNCTMSETARGATRKRAANAIAEAAHRVDEPDTSGASAGHSPAFRAAKTPQNGEPLTSATPKATAKSPSTRVIRPPQRQAWRKRIACREAGAAAKQREAIGPRMKSCTALSATIAPTRISFQESVVPLGELQNDALVMCSSVTPVTQRLIEPVVTRTAREIHPRIEN